MRNEQWNTVKGGSRVFEIWQVAVAIVLSVLLLSLAVAAIFPREENVYAKQTSTNETEKADYDSLFVEEIRGTHDHDVTTLYDNPHAMFAQVVDGRLRICWLDDIKNLDEITTFPDLTNTLKKLSVDTFLWHFSRTDEEFWCIYDAGNIAQIERAGRYLLPKLTPESTQPIKMTTHGEKTEEALVDGH